MNRYRFAVRCASAILIVVAALGCTPAAAPPAADEAAERRRAPSSAPDDSTQRIRQDEDERPKPPPPRREPQRPAQVDVAGDGRSLQLTSAVRTFALPMEQIFADPVRRIERVAILGQEDRGERFDLLLRVEASSDPEVDHGRCRKGRETTLLNLAFDAAGGSVSNTSVIASCLNRIRLVGERRLGDGRSEYALRQKLDDGSDMQANLVYDLAHPGRDIEL
ncbi:hypothetical protein K4L06_00820 [Lysobacter sp. BMK333-48F3]|uniref:hypothetical protein n=1 Tax=Lysobacter sp. BMK333-48F3 TaxID=2867962 RepID=UPI001C8CAB6A|nr:hypothetical protein [Lysobacter sp. BMK333-48F3]MBX9399835.1 hypothetical protein [Lysobacter sp. BMK333-48F3]